MMRKDVNKPKGKTSAYAFFVQTCREEHRKKNPEQSVNFAEFSKKCSERWKSIDPLLVQPWTVRALQQSNSLSKTVSSEYLKLNHNHPCVKSKVKLSSHQHWSWWQKRRSCSL
ncbi:non-histone chromosomal protein 6A-like isoform X1 [Mastacembelus armatus]|uniref:non-histone chromosomal protein 6A-like isoform X1 n=1 Tax=Mastacembelus armatus TaxID=205130 RepID=UPI000E45A8DF|nr:non-histone chromosomal protein 6A-like isoform X1 [Mastacembelus armatus]